MSDSKYLADQMKAWAWWKGKLYLSKCLLLLNTVRSRYQAHFELYNKNGLVKNKHSDQHINLENQYRYLSSVGFS